MTKVISFISLFALIGLHSPFEKLDLGTRNILPHTQAADKRELALIYFPATLAMLQYFHYGWAMVRFGFGGRRRKGHWPGGCRGCT